MLLQDPSAVALTREDWKLLNQRWSQTILPKQPEDVQSQWAACSDVKGQKIALQHKVIGAWLVDPTLGKTFKQQLSEVVELKGQTKESQWITKKELLLTMDESEAEEMLECGALEYRRNPLNKKRLQFKRVVIKETTSVQKGRTLRISGNQETDPEMYAGLNKQLERLDFRGDRLVKLSDKGKLHTALGGACDSSDEEDDKPKKDKPKKPKHVLKGKPGGASDSEAEAEDPEPEDPEKKNKELGAEVKKLSAALSKNLLALSSSLALFQKSSFCVAKQCKEIAKVIQNGENHKKALDKLIIVGAKPAQLVKGKAPAELANDEILTELANLKKVLSADQVNPPIKATSSKKK